MPPIGAFTNLRYNAQRFIQSYYSINSSRHHLIGTIERDGTALVIIVAVFGGESREHPEGDVGGCNSLSVSSSWFKIIHTYFGRRNNHERNSVRS